MRNALTTVVFALVLAFPSVPAKAGVIECEFYTGARAVHYPGYGWACIHDTLSGNCSFCCTPATNTCCVNGNCF